ncbi:MAG: glucose-6-phosphate isomerase [Candidatus Aenigmarchaeota archaeon]|nr:glucose-6-phosphate isomerase [Candidatus Aenigmarchaeota archaeon]
MFLRTGLPLRLENSRLVFRGMPSVAPAFRTAKELKDVATVTMPDNEILYAMYRNIQRPEHRELFRQRKVRYDITVMLPRMLGAEYPKTVGHYHSLSLKVSFPEVYEVLYGRAHFLLQQGKGRIIEDAAVVAAQAGDVVIVPPDYGHITINPSREVLVLGNLIAVNAQSDYKLMLKYRGGAYFETPKGFVPNRKLKSPPLRLLNARRLGRMGTKSPLYSAFAKNPETFDFLTNPEKHLKDLKRVLPKK